MSGSPSRQRRILLVEPDYRNKYPPLGLMKLATFHKQRGDLVRFVKGCRREVRDEGWDSIYVTTLFSFFWKRTVETIKYYSRSPGNPRLLVGGIMATLMRDELEAETGVRVVPGLLDTEGKLGLKDDGCIDSAVPDYDILDDIDYEYPVVDAYFGYATRGCIRNCRFCAVPKLEPEYLDYLPLEHLVETVDRRFGPKTELLLLDNNVLASHRFDRIMDEIQEVGFAKGAKLRRRMRTVDFNQGLDARLLSKHKMKRLAELPMRPVRIAFDSIKMEKTYTEKIKLAAKHDFLRLSNYVLFNHDSDTPEDFYQRLRINVELNEALGIQIYSFPMKYIPVTAKDRSFISKNWNWRYIRGVQCILNATHGVVGPKKKFFLKAFGKDVDEFLQIITMPEDYILFRAAHEQNSARDWLDGYLSLSEYQRAQFNDEVLHGRLPQGRTGDPVVDELLGHYQPGDTAGGLSPACRPPVATQSSQQTASAHQAT